MRFNTSSLRCGHPCRILSFSGTSRYASRIFKGGECVISMSVLVGISENFYRRISFWSIKAQSEIGLTNGVPKNL